MTFYDEIMAAIDSQDFEKALDLIDENRETHGNEAEFFIVQASLCMSGGEYETAVDLLENGMKKHPQDALLPLNLAYVYKSQEDLDSAYRYFSRARMLSYDAETNAEIDEECAKIAQAPGFIPNTSIVVLFYNNLEMNKQCIESIKRYTTPHTYEIIAVDNASSDGTTRWMQNQTGIKKVFNETNLGFPAGMNSGIAEAAPGNDLLILNNDVVVSPNWLTNLKKCLYSAEDIGAACASSSNVANFQSISTTYEGIGGYLDFAKQNNISDPARWEERLRLIMVCFLVKNQAWRDVGVLDEIFTPGNFEDDDYCFRLRLKGYRLMLCRDSYIHHHGSASFSKIEGGYLKLLEKNRKVFEKKWKADIYSILADMTAVTIIDRYEAVTKNVLHINCGSQETLLYAKNAHPSLSTRGLTQDSRMLTPDFMKRLNISEWVPDDDIDGLSQEDQAVIFTADGSLEENVPILRRILSMPIAPVCIVIRAEFSKQEFLENPQLVSALGSMQIAEKVKEKETGEGNWNYILIFQAPAIIRITGEELSRMEL